MPSADRPVWDNPKQAARAPNSRKSPGSSLPLVGVLEGCVDGVAQRPHDAAAGLAFQQGPNHVLFAQLTGEVQRGQPFVAQVVQDNSRGSAQDLGKGSNK